jgi:hypothetical protein
MTGGKMIIYRPKEKKDTIVHKNCRVNDVHYELSPLQHVHYDLSPLQYVYYELY